MIEIFAELFHIVSPLLRYSISQFGKDCIASFLDV